MVLIVPQKIGMVVACGVENSGGIGRVMGNVMQPWKSDPTGSMHIQMYDPRGAGSIFLSPYFLLRSLISIATDRLTHKIDLIHVNLSSSGSSLRKFFVISLAKLIRTPVIVHLHGSRFDTFYTSLPAPLKKAIRWMFGISDHVIVLGQGWANFLIENVGVDPKKISIIPNGVPKPLLQDKKQEGASVPHLLFLGRLGERKGVPDLLAALAKEEIRKLDWKATLAGDGDVAYYQAQAQRLGLSHRITFPGWVGTDQTAQFLYDADILVLPSYAEGLPMSVLEGLAHGIAVITTPVGAIPEFLTDGQTALLVNPGDVEALSQSVKRLIENADERARIAANGFVLFEREFDIRIMAERIKDVYGTVARGRAGSIGEIHD